MFLKIALLTSADRLRNGIISCLKTRVKASTWKHLLKWQPCYHVVSRAANKKLISLCCLNSWSTNCLVSKQGTNRIHNMKSEKCIKHASWLHWIMATLSRCSISSLNVLQLDVLLYVSLNSKKLLVF